MRTTPLSFLIAMLIGGAIGLAPEKILRAQPTPSPNPASSPGFSTPALPTPAGLAPLELRMANAKSVKVQTSILGLELGSSLEQAHAKLDKLKDPSQPSKEEKEDSEKGEQENESRALWQLAKSEYSAVYIKVDDKKRITYLNAFLRPGKEIPFNKIGEIKKAPVQDSNVIAWDVIRPSCPLFRVVASGKDRRANNVAIFFVKRPRSN
jgi:hypothetical protein